MIAKNRFSSILSLIVILFSFNSCNEVFSEKTVSPINTQLVFVDSEDIVVDGKLVYPVVNGEPAIGNRCSEIIDLSFLDDNDEKNAASVTKVFAVPRGEDQSIEAWIDSCRLAGINEVKAPYFRAVFISENEISSGVFIGDYTPSSYKPNEYIAKLNKDAYKERNNTPLQINDVEITYHCEGTAANVTITFEPLADTLSCSFIYHAINEYNWARTDNNTRYGYKSTTIVPGQTKYEFNIAPEVIDIDLDSYEKIADLALVGVENVTSLYLKRPNFTAEWDESLRNTRLGQAYEDSFWQENTNKLQERARRIFGYKSTPSEYMDYDHRSSFWQKITLHTDLRASWPLLLIAFALALLFKNILDDVQNISNKYLRTILTAISVVMLILTVAYAVLWFVLAFF